VYNASSSVARACDVEKAWLEKDLLDLGRRGTKVQVKCLPVMAGKGLMKTDKSEYRWDPTLYVLSASLLLSRADYFVGKLGTDFGRTVHELMQARCCKPEGCLPNTFDYERTAAVSIYTPSGMGKKLGSPNGKKMGGHVGGAPNAKKKPAAKKAGLA